MLSNSCTPMFCVKCGAKALVQSGEKAFACEACDFVYFHNVATGVCAVIRYQNKILLVKRAEQPALGKWDFPGGFVDYNESNEQALSRELQEELALSVDTMGYLFSFPNEYQYKNVDYRTLDAFFLIELTTLPSLSLQQSEVSAYQWVEVSDIQPEDMAFLSGKAGIRALLQRA